MITRIVSQDVPIINNYEMDVIPQIMRVIGAVALKPSGELPQTKLSENLNIPVVKHNLCSVEPTAFSQSKLLISFVIVVLPFK